MIIKYVWDQGKHVSQSCPQMKQIIESKTNYTYLLHFSQLYMLSPGKRQTKVTK